MRQEQAFEFMQLLARMRIAGMVASGARPDADAGDVMDYAVVIAPNQLGPIDLVDLAFQAHYRGFKLWWTQEQGFVIDPPPDMLETDDRTDDVEGQVTHLDSCDVANGQGTEGCPVCEAMLVEQREVQAGRARPTCLAMHGEFCPKVPCSRCGNGMTRPMQSYAFNVGTGSIF